MTSPSGPATSIRATAFSGTDSAMSGHLTPSHGMPADDRASPAAPQHPPSPNARSPSAIVPVHWLEPRAITAAARGARATFEQLRQAIVSLGEPRSERLALSRDSSRA